MMQWTPYGATVDEFQAHVRTFRAVFPHVIVAFGPGGYGFYLIGSDQPLTFDDATIGGPRSARHPGGHLLGVRLTAEDGRRLGSKIPAWSGSRTMRSRGHRRRPADHRRPAPAGVLPAPPTVWRIGSVIDRAGMARLRLSASGDVGRWIAEPIFPAVSVLGRAPVRLFLTSGVVLFVELLLIRWIPANVMYVGFFRNFLLMASFLGIGAGILSAATAGGWCCRRWRCSSCDRRSWSTSTSLDLQLRTPTRSSSGSRFEHRRRPTWVFSSCRCSSC